jgi:PAS domain S-box-containing protein
MTADYSSDIPRLRRTIGDLLALSAIPEAWVEKEPAAIAAALAELLIESLKMDFAFVCLCDPAVNRSTEVMRGSAWKAFPEWIQEHRAEPRRISRKEILLNSGGADVSCRGLVIPIGVEGERGFIAVASGDADFPDQIDQQLLSVAANSAATAFRNAHLINELRNAQKVLSDREREIRMARDELETKVGERTSELRRSERELRDVVDASGLDVTKRIVRLDDEVRYIRCVGAPVVEDGTLQRIVGTAMDVTEHELLTQELRRREAYLAEAQRLSHTGSFGWKPDSGEIVGSDETYRIFEYDRAEKPTMNMVFQRVHPQDRLVVQQVIDRVSRSTDFEHEYRLAMPSGAIKHIHVRAHALSYSSGNIEIIGAVTDITERKTNEDKIRRLVEAGILGIFIANVDDEIVEANQAFLRMLQYSRQDLGSSRLRWTDLTPPEWREHDQRLLTEALETGIFQPYEKEFFRKDGSRVPVLIGGALFQNAKDGVAFVLDLTEQKRAEEKIRGQEIELRQILDRAPQLTGGRAHSDRLRIRRLSTFHESASNSPSTRRAESVGSRRGFGHRDGHSGRKCGGRA